MLSFKVCVNLTKSANLTNEHVNLTNESVNLNQGECKSYQGYCKYMAAHDPDISPQ